jgi:hypothetical protein
MRNILMIISVFACIANGVSQTTNSSTPNQVISSGTAQPNPTYSAGITNASNTTVSVAALDAQLKNLQVAVDSTLPMLTTFNQQNGAGTSAAAQEIRDLLGRVLNRNRVSNAAPAATQGGGLLGGLLGTTNGTSLSADTLRQLQTLQKDLEPVAPLLQSLNGAAPSTAPAGTIGRNYGTNAEPNSGLTPTGR